MPTATLGQARDKITSVSRVSGDGSAGSLDTYKIVTECTPSGYNFTVQNGTNGTSGTTTYSYVIEDSDRLAMAKVALTPLVNKIVDAKYGYAGGTIPAIIAIVGTLSSTSVSIFVNTNPTSASWVLLDSFYGTNTGTLFATVVTEDESNLDTELDGTSLNAVTNKGIVDGLEAYDASFETMFESIEEFLDEAITVYTASDVRDIKKIYGVLDLPDRTAVVYASYMGQLGMNGSSVHAIEFMLYSNDGNDGYISIAYGNTGSWTVNRVGSEIDDALSASSTNPVRNSVIYDALQTVDSQISDINSRIQSLSGDLPQALFDIPQLGRHALASNDGDVYWKDDDPQVVYALMGSTITSTEYNLSDIGTVSSTDSTTTFTVQPASMSGSLVIEL